MERLEKLIRVRRVEIVDGLTVRIEFEDSTVKLLDLAPLMRGPIFDELIQDFGLFNRITVEHGTIAWPNGADIDPDVLYYDLTPASMEEVDLTH
jgi:hypothetical protein